jgi:hypothetical protein
MASKIPGVAHRAKIQRQHPKAAAMTRGHDIGNDIEVAP